MSVLDVAEVDAEVSAAHGGGAETDEVYKKKKLGFLFWAFIASLPAMAQDYPAKPVRILSGFAAGGAADIIGRVVNACRRAGSSPS